MLALDAGAKGKRFVGIAAFLVVIVVSRAVPLRCDQPVLHQSRK